MRGRSLILILIVVIRVSLLSAVSRHFGFGPGPEVISVRRRLSRLGEQFLDLVHERIGQPSLPQFGKILKDDRYPGFSVP